MSLTFVFWFLMLCWILFSCWFGFRTGGDRLWFGGGVLIFILFLVIGLKLFGFPIHG